MSKANDKIKNSGFTIIELMIATSVFAIVLVVASSGILTIGRMYYRGITASRTQETTRSVINTITNTVQFTAQSRADDGVVDTAGTPQAVCFGYDRYTYIINSQVGGGSIGLMHDRRPDLGGCPPIAGGGTELLPENTRLSDFRITALNASTFRINVGIAYGANDLLSTYDDNGNPVGGGGHPNIEEARAAQCKPGIAGSNFCGVSTLETTINKRVE